MGKRENNNRTRIEIVVERITKFPQDKLSNAGTDLWTRKRHLSNSDFGQEDLVEEALTKTVGLRIKKGNFAE